MRSVLVTAVVLSSVMLVACEQGPKPPLKTAMSLPDTAPRDTPDGQWKTPGGPAEGDSGSPTAGSIQIDRRILNACGDVKVAHFAFDSAAISGQAADTLGALARCFVTGPLAGARLNLVGHADPRGGVAYNIALGQQRAGSVATFLAERGLAEERMGTLSKGAFEASGTDEESWALDRRVEVFLAE